MRAALPPMIASTLALTACTTAAPTAPASPAAPASTTSVSAAPAVPGEPPLDRFVAAVQQKLPDLAVDRRDEEIADLGQTACDALSAGQDPAAVARELTDEGVPADQASPLLALARTTVCGA